MKTFLLIVFGIPGFVSFLFCTLYAMEASNLTGYEPKDITVLISKKRNTYWKRAFYFFVLLSLSISLFTLTLGVSFNYALTVFSWYTLALVVLCLFSFVTPN